MEDIMKRFLGLFAFLCGAMMFTSVGTAIACCTGPRNERFNVADSFVIDGKEYVRHRGAILTRDHSDPHAKFANWNLKEAPNVITYTSENSPLTIFPLASVHVAENGDLWVVGCEGQTAQFDGVDWKIIGDRYPLDTIRYVDSETDKEIIVLENLWHTSTATKVVDNTLYIVRKDLVEIIDLSSGKRTVHRDDSSHLSPANVDFDIENGVIATYGWSCAVTFEMKSGRFTHTEHDDVGKCKSEHCSHAKKRKSLWKSFNDRNDFLRANLQKGSTHYVQWYHDSSAFDIEVDKNGTMYVITRNGLHVIPNGSLTGVEEERNPTMFSNASVYPNPAVNFVTVDLGLEPPPGTEVSIVDLSGKLIRKAVPQQQMMRIETSRMIGPYMLLVTSPYAREVRTLVVL